MPERVSLQTATASSSPETSPSRLPMSARLRSLPKPMRESNAVLDSTVRAPKLRAAVARGLQRDVVEHVGALVVATVVVHDVHAAVGRDGELRHVLIGAVAQRRVVDAHRLAPRAGAAVQRPHPHVRVAVAAVVERDVQPAAAAIDRERRKRRQKRDEASRRHDAGRRRPTRPTSRRGPASARARARSGRRTAARRWRRGRPRSPACRRRRRGRARRARRRSRRRPTAPARADGRASWRGRAGSSAARRRPSAPTTIGLAAVKRSVPTSRACTQLTYSVPRRSGSAAIRTWKASGPATRRGTLSVRPPSRDDTAQTALGVLPRPCSVTYDDVQRAVGAERGIGRVALAAGPGGIGTFVRRHVLPASAETCTAQEKSGPSMRFVTTRLRVIARVAHDRRRVVGADVSEVARAGVDRAIGRFQPRPIARDGQRGENERRADE